MIQNTSYIISGTQGLNRMDNVKYRILNPSGGSKKVNRKSMSKSETQDHIEDYETLVKSILSLKNC